MRFPTFIDPVCSLCFRIVAAIVIQIIVDNIKVCLDREIHRLRCRELVHFKHSISFLGKSSQHLKQIFYVTAKFIVLFGQFIAHREIDHRIVAVGFYTNKTITVAVLIDMAVLSYYKMLTIYCHELTTNPLCIALRNKRIINVLLKYKESGIAGR